MSLPRDKLLNESTKNYDHHTVRDETNARIYPINNDEQLNVLANNEDRVKMNENKQHALAGAEITNSWNRENIQQNANQSCAPNRVHFNRGSGLCGLVNPNRICYRNCVIQCLSHCPPLADYFLEDRHLGELNVTNSEGTKGQLALAVGELLKKMWSGKFKYLLPNRLNELAKMFTDLYGPYEKEFDAQEFLTFLFDKLHGDLNRAKDLKGGINIETEGRTDQEVAKETWDSYLKRNDSVIVDLFFGLLRSKLICPNCEMVSVTFDPLCFLTLPLPDDKDKVFKILYVPFDQQKKEKRFEIKTSKSSRVRDLLLKLSVSIGCGCDRLVLAAVSNHHIHRFFSRDDSLETVVEVCGSGGALHLYDLPDDTPSAATTVIPVYHWEARDAVDSNSFANNRSSFNSCLFGTPSLITLPTAACQYATIHSLVSSKLSRYLLLPAATPTNNNINNSTISEEGMDVDSENENEKESCEEMFTLYLVNTKDTTGAKKIPNNGQLIKLPEHQGDQCLILQWTTTAMKKFFKPQTPQHDNSLSMPESKSSHKLNLQDCLDIFASTEKLESGNTWNCPSCKKPSVGGTKKFDVWTLPNVLIINLKRFSHFENRNYKLNTRVDYPLENLKLNDYLVNKNHPPVSYNLIGVINHYGGTTEGHYTAFAKNRIDNQWYCFDDSNICKMKEKDVVASTAYVLFYMKNDLMKGEKGT